MTNSDIEPRVRSVLAEVFGMQPDLIGADTSSETVEKWDSLAHVTLVLALEDEFAIHFDEEETLEILNFPLIVKTIAGHLP